MEFFKSAVASAISKGPPFPYTFGERVDIDQSIWTLQNGTRRVSSNPTHSAYPADAFVGGWLEMQHLLVRHHSQQDTPSPGEERIAQVQNTQASRHRQSA